MNESKQNTPEEINTKVQNLSDDVLDTVAGGALYPDKYHIQCPSCLKFIRKTPEAFNKHNWESGCQYKL